MRLLALMFGIVGLTGIAVAGDYDQLNPYDSSDYSGKVFYQFNFNGHQSSTSNHLVGFKVVNERAQFSGAPALFQTEFRSGTEARMLINGVDIAPGLIAHQNAGKGGMLGGMTTVELVAALSIAALGLYVVSDTQAEDEPGAPAGTGTGGS